jgi:flagellar hook assembly protein FlgD
LVELQSAVGVETLPPASSELTLAAPAPNPLTNRTTIRYFLPREEALELSVRDVGGRTVTVLVDGTRPAGEHSVSWDGRADAGSRVAPGVYFVTARSPSSTEATRLVIVR